MSFFSSLFKSNKQNYTHNNKKYTGYSDELKNFCEYQDKYLPIWNLAEKYTEKINYYYSSYLDANKEEDFNNLLMYCQKYINLLPQLEEARKKENKILNTENKQFYCIAHHKLAMAYEKSGCYNSAINVCTDAINLGYSDGTKGGFEARLKRIIKKQDEINKSINKR